MLYIAVRQISRNKQKTHKLKQTGILMTEFAQLENVVQKLQIRKWETRRGMILQEIIIKNIVSIKIMWQPFF